MIRRGNEIISRLPVNPDCILRRQPPVRKWGVHMQVALLPSTSVFIRKHLFSFFLTALLRFRKIFLCCSFFSLYDPLHCVSCSGQGWLSCRMQWSAADKYKTLQQNPSSIQVRPSDFAVTAVVPWWRGWFLRTRRNRRFWRTGWYGRSSRIRCLRWACRCRRIPKHLTKQTLTSSSWKTQPSNSSWKTYPSSSLWKTYPLNPSWKTYPLNSS